EYTKVGTVYTTQQLKATEGQPLKFDYQRPAADIYNIDIKLTFDENAPTECRSDNNETSHAIKCVEPIN
ncbi:MAG: hypothetical protein J6S69_04370, partial [Proteobacteria bacterium]|nr:hypothetical protein [Pseudomonadota bacterium]